MFEDSELEALKDTFPDLDREGKVDENDSLSDFRVGETRRSSMWKFVAALLLLANTLQAISYLLMSRSASEESLCDVPNESNFAGLKKEYPLSYPYEDTIYFSGADFKSPNRTHDDMGWSSLDLDINNGVVVLEDHQVSDFLSPTTERWPWDESKGIYRVFAFHQIHCLTMIRKVLYEGFEQVVTSGDHRHHALHCVEWLRDEVMCGADDTIGYFGSEALHSDLTLPRTCRSWEELASWARSNSACFSETNFRAGRDDRHEYFNVCPDGKSPLQSGRS